MSRATPLPCEWCATPESTRRGRRFCSVACRRAHDAREDPVKRCEVCGAEFGRAVYPSGQRERRSTYASRTTCATAACKAAMMRRKAFDLNPHQPGKRTILGRSCDECGCMFVPFNHGWICGQCRWDRLPSEATREYAQRRLAHYHAQQAASLPDARRRGYRWTGPELELIATRSDLTTQELAALLGRTVAAVMSARTRLAEPKWRAVAGVE